MLQPLYLDGQIPVAVLLDGPALRLRRASEADAFAPLGRLARVVVRGAVHWRPEALAACMEWGVPVVFMAAGGSPRGALVPLAPPSNRSDLPALLDAAACLPGFEGRLRDMFNSMQRDAVRALVRRWRLPAGDLRPAVVRRLCLARPGADPERCAALHARLDGLVRAEVIQDLVRDGAGPQFLAARTGGFDLPAALADVLSWTMWPAAWRLDGYLALHGARNATHAAVHRRAVRAYEAEAPRLAKLRREAIRRLAATLASDVP